MTAPTYPSSLDVSPGQPTSIVQFNRLRADALRLGAASADAVNLGSFLSSYSSGVSISYLATNRLRILYDAHFPPTLMIRGVMCQANANVDLPANSFSGGAADWYIFANRTAGSSAFTLTVNTSATEGADQRLIGVCHWDGAAMDPTSIQTYATGQSGGKSAVITLQAWVYYTSQTSYAAVNVCHQLLDFTRLKTGAKAAYLVANLFGTSATAYARFYNSTDSVTIVEISTTATVAGTMVKSADILSALPNGPVETRFEWKTSGSRADCYWGALVIEY